MPPYKQSVEGWLCGERNIRAYFHVRLSTLLEWAAKEDFPLGRLPHGSYAVCPALAAAWLMKRSQNLRKEGRFFPNWLQRKLKIEVGKDMESEQPASECRQTEAT